MTESTSHPARKTIPYGSPLYNQIAQFLIEEAVMLDDNRLSDWQDQLTEDLVYTAPLRTTRWNEDPVSDIVRSVQHFKDDRQSINLRIRRLTESKSVWAENPHHRTKRFVANILVHETEVADEYAVTSYILLMKNRLDEPEYQFVTARRDDVLRLADGALKLAKREFVVDMARLGVPNLISFM